MPPVVHHGDCLEILRSLPDESVHSVCTDPPYELGFMGKRWDASGIAYSVQLWAEALRALKPGGHLAAFGGSRTYHRMTCAIEDAGFEIRDGLQWLYGSGFPKSANVGAGVMKLHGLSPAEDEWTPEAEQWRGHGTALKPAAEPIVLARKPLSGTVAANVLAHGTGALNIDACRVGTAGGTTRGANGSNAGKARNTLHGGNFGVEKLDAGRWPSNVLLDEHAAAELDAQSGVTTSTGGSPGASRQRSSMAGGVLGARPHVKSTGLGDTGGASRYFPTFRYQAKAPTRERPKVDGVAHPTVKPLELMRWLVRLVTPPGGTVLDPFAGSGTTVEAALIEGFPVIAVEREADYLPLIEQRIARAAAVHGR